MPLASRLVLAPAAAFTGPPVAESSPFTRVKVGDVGVAETMCRPVGKVRFGDDLLDASSEGGIVERGATVRVLANDGNRLIVEEVRKAT
jgi:membrane-bound ClpP family serine protease